MRIIQAPRKHQASKDKPEARTPKKTSVTSKEISKDTQAANSPDNHAEGGSRGYPERRSSMSRGRSTSESTQPFGLASGQSIDLGTGLASGLDETDDLNVGYRSRGKNREKVKKDVDIIHKSIELLARREHSVVELKQKLKTREYSEDKIEQALVQLIRDGLVCDERFTEAYVRHRTMRGFGPTKIATELNSKGVSTLLFEEYIDSSSPHWLDLALNAYQKKFGEIAPTTYAEWTKRARFLQGRGFSSSIIQNVCPSIDFD
ncbi:MAG: regulatory protein RecX [Arenicella sp.]|nr:regulatory protein RecX [Arenicella sp.]